MANDNEMRIVISAEDDYSASFDRAAKKAEESASRISSSFERTGTAAAAARLDEYASSVDKVSAAEARRGERMAGSATGLQVKFGAPVQSDEQLVADEERRNQIKLTALAVYNASVLRETGKTRAELSAMEAAYTDEEIALARKKRDLQIAYAAGAFGMTANMMQNLYVLSGKQNNDMFRAMKAFAIAETLISTYSAAQKSFDKGITETGSYWGGVAYAAAATIAGLARVSEIQRQHPGEGSGGGISAAGNANPSYQGGSSSAYPVPQRFEGDAPKAAQQVTVNVYNPLSDQNWRKIVEENIVPAINDAAERNIVLTVRNMG
ncbi:MAG: hypothetical protein HZB85_02135 [Deltaproteobacteria bacterium]|nr:hypothetical protein [Deltaproteobacteria bacterium]